MPVPDSLRKLRLPMMVALLFGAAFGAVAPSFYQWIVAGGPLPSGELIWGTGLYVICVSAAGAAYIGGPPRALLRSLVVGVLLWFGIQAVLAMISRVVVLTELSGFRLELLGHIAEFCLQAIGIEARFQEGILAVNHDAGLVRFTPVETASEN